MGSLVRLILAGFLYELPQTELAMLLHELGYRRVVELLDIRFFVCLIHTYVCPPS